MLRSYPGSGSDRLTERDCFFCSRGNCLLTFNPFAKWGSFMPCLCSKLCPRGSVPYSGFIGDGAETFAQEQYKVFFDAEPAVAAVWQGKAKEYLRDNDRGMITYCNDDTVIVDFGLFSDPLILLAMRVLDIYDKAVSADAYSACDHCGRAVETEPSSYGWRADFWNQAELGGGPICGDCLRGDDSLMLSYLDWCAESSRRAVTVKVYLPDRGYTLLIDGLYNGLYGGQDADPEPIRQFITEQKLRCVFVAFPGQFDVAFDVWVTTAEHTPPADSVIADLRQALLTEPESWGQKENGYRCYPHLRATFRMPDPAVAMQNGLKRISNSGAHFSSIKGDGSVVVYDSFADMQAGKGHVLPA